LLPAWLLGGLLAAVRWLRDAVRQHPAQATATAVSATAAVVVAAVLATSGQPAVPTPPAPPRPSADVFAGTVPILPAPSGTRLANLVGREVTSDGVTVQSVPADEGFWIGHGADRLWVQLAVRTESPQHIRPGQTVQFRGRLVQNPPGFPQRVGLTAVDGAGQLQQQGVHILVPLAALTVR
jgi:hypothetical protein